MQTVEILALVIFILTYLFIAVNRTPWYEIKRSYVALAGGLLMLLAGALTLDRAFDSIDFKVIFLLLGMMCVVAGLEYTGFFSLLSDILMRHSSPGPKLLLSVMVLSAFTSAIALNDAVVLMFTPILRAPEGPCPQRKDRIVHIAQHEHHQTHMQPRHLDR